MLVKVFQAVVCTVCRAFVGDKNVSNKRCVPGRPRRSWEDNVEMDLREIGWGSGLD